MARLSMMTPSLVGRNMMEIGRLFPNVMTEIAGKNGEVKLAIDFDLLRQELSDVLVAGEKERYQLTWPGKKEAILNANTPIDKTLRPVKEDSVDWDNTQNLYIEGDNLEVLKLLQESYLNKVKMIYIDPPYNTGKDFVYKDDFKISPGEYHGESGQLDEDGKRLFLNTESNGRFHSCWLTMLYSRLKISRNLLRDDGVLFISIDDNEVSNLRRICDEIFGESNFVANVIWEQGRKSASSSIAINHEYCMIYCKNKSYINENIETYWREKKQGLEVIYEKESELKKMYGDDYNKMGIELKSFYKQIGSDHPAYRHKHYNHIDSRGIYFAADASAPDKPETRSHKPLIHPITKKPTLTPRMGWRYNENTLKRLVEGDRIHFGADEKRVPCVKRYLKETEYEVAASVFYKDGRGASSRLNNLLGGNYFDFPKDEFVIEKLVNFCVDPASNDIILDFFSGSATTAHAVMQLNAEDGGNRKFIMVQLPEETDEKSKVYKAGYKNICEIGKERIRRAAKKIKEETGAEIDYGFRVYRIDSSNMKDVYYTPEMLGQINLNELTSNIKEDRTGEDLLIQVMLELGLELSLPMEIYEIEGKLVHKVAGNSLIACFDPNVPEVVIKQIASEQPLRVVFRDSSFQDDSARINVEELFKLLSQSTEIRVL